MIVLRVEHLSYNIQVGFNPQRCIYLPPLSTLEVIPE